MKLNTRRIHVPRPWPVLLSAALSCLIVSVSGTGCKLIRTTASVPQRTVAVFFPGGQSNQPDPGDLQQSLMRFADAYSARTIQMVDELTGVPGSPFTRERALRFKISTAGGVITIAAGENPYANLLDMVSLATITQMVLQDHWVTTTNGALFKQWLTYSEALETNIWFLAAQVLSEKQQVELRQSIDRHYASMIDVNNLFLIHPQDLLMPRSLAKKKTNSQTVFDLAALDPLSGLDPAVREITETRLFAARALYSLQRMPWIVRWHAELLVLETTNQPKIAQALTNVAALSEGIDRASQAAESLSQTAAALPAQIADERKALVAALDAQEGKITTLLQSGTEMSTSLNTTIGTFDALMKRFGVGEPDTNATPPNPNAKPFDVLDYATTAEQITAMSKELTLVINDLNNSLDSPALDRLSIEATTNVRGLMNHIFMLAAGLVVLILVCALTYRAVAGRRAKP